MLLRDWLLSPINQLLQKKIWKFYIIIIVIFYIATGVTVSYKISTDKETKIIYNSKEIFFKTLTNLNLEKNDKLIKKTFNSIDREYKWTLSEYWYINTLEDYLVYRINVEKNNDLDIINTIIENEQKNEPYSNLNNEQKRIFNNINRLNDNNDLVWVKYNIDQLTLLFKNQNEKIFQLELENNKSYPLNILSILLWIISLILTILFFYISKKTKS